MDWNERYSEPGFSYGKAPNEFLSSVVSYIPKGRVLSLAEGEGRNATFLASLGYDVTGVDSSVVGLGKAGDLADETGVTISTILADLNEYRIVPDYWEGILACYCHVPSSIRIPLHRSAVCGLKSGGVFVLEAFSKDQLKYDSGGPKSLDMLLSLDEMMIELSGLNFLHAVQCERIVCEGYRHTGLASVVQILAMKP